MLKPALVACALIGLVASNATAAGKKPTPSSGQSQGDDRDMRERAQRDAADAPEPAYAPPAFAQPPSRYVVLTEGQKRCGVARGCELDSRQRCPPCW